ncbi:MAG TPA: hypothetical protein VNL15_07130 [Dehalococcoidia bacterium]|nr:hypothetical protein [Dehalococcoidia bacterium]
MDLPNERTLTDSEIAVAVAEAILNDRQNPGSDIPFQPSRQVLLARLGLPGRIPDEQAWRQKFFESNPDLNFRLEEYCWRLVGLGFLVPQNGGVAFRPTAKGTKFLEGFDPMALTLGGLESKLEEIGFSVDDLCRQYAKRAQDCFLAGHYETSIVMLGVAAESLVHEVAATLSALASMMPSLRQRPDRPTAVQDLEWLIDALENHRRELKKVMASKDTDSDWVEMLSRLLAGTGQAIRMTRNELGHPTGINASQDDALQLMVLFPRFADGCNKALEALGHF